MGVYEIIDLRLPGIFYIGIIIQFHQQLVSNGSVGLCIPRIGRVIMICNEVYFDGMVIRKSALSESIHCIQTHLDVVVKFLEVQSSDTFKFYPVKEFIDLF